MNTKYRRALWLEIFKATLIEASTRFMLPEDAVAKAEFTADGALSTIERKGKMFDVEQKIEDEAARAAARRTA